MSKTSVARLVEWSLTSKGKRVVSIPDIVHSIRASLPACEHTDEELAELIAAIAVRRGCDVSFKRSPALEVASKAAA